LPSYLPGGRGSLMEANIAPHVSAVSAAIEHVRKRPDADPDRLGMVGFSLGAGIAMSYITTSPPGSVKVFADFYGYVEPLLGAGVANFPPTIIFHNKNDSQFVPPDKNSVPLADALAKAMPPIEHVYKEYQETWPEGYNHAFKPDGTADTNSRSL